ncbi:MAG: ribosome maturation factor RimP [Coriobacteriales bacterium]|nr:ribosome maturation factor RimP [Coriobacteriales bacterium]
MRDEKRQRLIDTLEVAATDHGFELVDVEFAGTGRARVIRVFLDRSGGLGIDDLAQANQWVDEVIGDNEPWAGPYTLEVSSPGIDRPLRTLEHFARFVGEEAKLATEPLDGRSNWTGTLVGVEGDTVLLTIDGEIRRVPRNAIKKARLKGRIDFKAADGKGDTTYEATDETTNGMTGNREGSDNVI